VVIEAADVSKAYGDRLLMDGVSFMLPPGGIIGSSDRTEPARRPCFA